MNRIQLAEDFQSTTAALLALIAKFSTETFNRKPADGGWSASQVAEHIFLFDSRLNQILPTATEKTDRDPTEKIAAFTARVSDRTNRIEAPAFLIPSDEPGTTVAITEKIIAERNQIASIINHADLSLVSSAFPHRFFGDMSAWEWITFISIHTRRHFPQLQGLL